MSYLYIMSNPAMPGLVKIGRTRRDAEKRRLELSASTSAPESFKVEAVYRGANWEPLIRGYLDHYRTLKREFLRGKTEFFRLDSHDAKEAVARYVHSKDLEVALSNLQNDHFPKLNSRISYIVNKRKTDYKTRSEVLVKHILPNRFISGLSRHSINVVNHTLISKLSRICDDNRINLHSHVYFTSSSTKEDHIYININLFSEHDLLHFGFTLFVGTWSQEGTVHLFVPNHDAASFSDISISTAYSNFLVPICKFIQNEEDTLLSELGDIEVYSDLTSRL
jgi:hypothetical protein